MTTPDTTIRIDKLVAERFSISRTAAQEAIRTGRVDLDGTRCDEPGRLVALDAILHFDPNRPKARRVVGSKLNVLYEDAHVVVVNKPPGILTLPTASHEPDSLSARVENYLTIRHGRKPYVGVIHRLDKETSGALAFAKSPKALDAFQTLFRKHEMERQYLAIVEGVVAREQATIRRALVIGGEGERHRVARGDDLGIDAVTHYRVVERFGPVATLLAVWLETGRTHQIRLHLASIGHPVVGDQRYRYPDRPRCKAQFDRQALHAQVLGFAHPLKNGEPIRVDATPPRDLRAFIKDLRFRYGIENAGG